MKKNLKRVSLLITEDQYELINNRELNLSGLVRDLLEDYLSEHKITLSVGEYTRELYERVVSNTGSTDEDLEVYLRESLLALLQNKIKNMQDLEKKLLKGQ
jgi:hypothetical protein